MAKGITESTVEEIKARIDLADLIASYGIQVKTAGVSKKACCPFHHEKTPSFNINENRGYYHCFGCGESGDAIKFVQKMDGLTFVEAVKKLAEQCGVKIEEKEDPAAGKRKRILALLAEITQDSRKLDFIPVVNDGVCRESARVIHAHVQRSIIHIRKAALGLVKLRRRYAEVKQHPVHRGYPEFIEYLRNIAEVPVNKRHFIGILRKTLAGAPDGAFVAVDAYEPAAVKAL